MGVITANVDLASMLNQVDDPMEIRDGSGALLGVFTPVNKSRPLAIPPGAKTTMEVFADLKKSTTDPVRLADLNQHLSNLEARDRE